MQEARAYSEVKKFGTDDIKEIALNIIKLPKVNTNRPRIVVITQGCDPVIVVQGRQLKYFQYCHVCMRITHTIFIHTMFNFSN